MGIRGMCLRDICVKLIYSLVKTLVLLRCFSMARLYNVWGGSADANNNHKNANCYSFMDTVCVTSQVLRRRTFPFVGNIDHIPIQEKIFLPFRVVTILRKSYTK